MGKTFKHGYMSLGHSFNSLHNFQCKKKTDRRKRKHLFRNDCNWIARDCDLSEKINMSITNLAPKNANNKKPYKIGYCPNTSNSYSQIKNNILSSIQKQTNIQFVNLNEHEKLEYLLKEECKKNEKMTYFADIINMKKQLKRRGKIGYFKGHNRLY